MRIFKTIETARKYVAAARSSGQEIGFVPTMGALHEGHLSLIRQAKAENQLAICSIYVNPTQFNNPADLAKYPRTFEADTALLEAAACDAVFCPSDAVMYPEGKQHSLGLDFGALNQVLEGAFRAGHFSGVGVILSKLFHIIAPHRVYFGQKDLQQLAVVRKLVADLFIDTSIVRVPTFRSSSGLALSSRNSRLSEEGRQKATALYRALRAVEDALLSRKASVAEAQTAALHLLQQQAIEVEYLAVVDAASFGTVSDIQQHGEVAACVAAYVEGVRLIDNIIIGEKPPGN